MPRALPVALALLVAAPAVYAQPTRPIREMRAFEPAFSAGLGLYRPGRRAAGPGVEYGYSRSVSVELSGETALGRRLGASASLMVAPLTKLRAENNVSVAITDAAPVLAADLGLAWRIKPWAPAFVAFGGGYTWASKTPVEGESGSVGWPHVQMALGLDHSLADRYGLRMRFTLRALGETPVSTAGVVGESALDFTLAVSVRMRRQAFR